MASPTVYKWTDVSAPQVRRNNKADFQALFQAVLIDGYGSQVAPGAGTNKWSIPFSDSTKFVLKQGGTSSVKQCIRFGNFGTSSTSFAYVTTAEDFTDINTPVNQWGGYHIDDTLPMGYASNATYHIPWIIIATERVLICQFGFNTLGVDTVLLDTQNLFSLADIGSWYFGDYESYNPSATRNQVVVHCQYDSTQSNNFSQVFTSSNTVYNKVRVASSFSDNWSGEIPGYFLYSRALNNTSTHNVGQTLVDDYVPSFPDAQNGSLYLEKPRFVSSKSVTGNLYGVLFPLQSHPFPGGYGNLAFNGAGDFAGEDLVAFTNEVGQYMIRLGDWGVE